MINATQKKLYAAVYMFTDKTILEALIKAKKERGVDVQIITDKISYGGLFGKAEELVKAGVATFVYNPSQATYNAFLHSNAIMHNKFALFDKTIWTGSFNWTRSASSRNKENVIVIYNNQVVHDTYLKQFESLKEECISFKSLPARSAKLYDYSIQLLQKIQRSTKTLETILNNCHA